MHDIDYTGPQGGMMGMAFAGGWAIATALWLAVGGVIWRFFVEPRIKQLEKDRTDDQAKCREETDRLRDRILQLETLLMLHGPQQLRQAMQAVASEARVEIRELREEIKP
ncbi:MAG: hypothetical protein J7500_15835 [Sphingomonas sp.]|uniref:hypothetical protein n=1 Tax=Sphingomonas sp. TaxID=28214 RepID=UPI001B059F3D|nr:hypothetical protein [Sphingomonas sp.]MBO9624179.1 hypothetical protein [Sphingomonas sp.]